MENVKKTIGEVWIYAIFLIYQMWDEDFLYMEKGVEILGELERFLYIGLCC